MIKHIHAEKHLLSNSVNKMLDEKIEKLEKILKQHHNDEISTIHVHLEHNKNEEEYSLKLVLDCKKLLPNSIIIHKHDESILSLINHSFKDLLLNLNKHIKMLQH